MPLLGLAALDKVWARDEGGTQASIAENLGLAQSEWSFSARHDRACPPVERHRSGDRLETKPIRLCRSLSQLARITSRDGHCDRSQVVSHD